jgi:hypothetical protein
MALSRRYDLAPVVVPVASALGRGEDGATTAMLVDTLFFLIMTAAHWHARHQHAQQAEAARSAAAHLRSAYHAATDTPIANLRLQGESLVAPVHDWYADQLRTALPDLATTGLAEPNWPALAPTLAQAQQVGEDPGALLVEAAGRREPVSADSINDVLVWRRRHMSDPPADARTPYQRNRVSQGPTTTMLPSPQPRSLRAGR